MLGIETLQEALGKKTYGQGRVFDTSGVQLLSSAPLHLCV